MLCPLLQILVNECKLEKHLYYRKKWVTKFVLLRLLCKLERSSLTALIPGRPQISVGLLTTSICICIIFCICSIIDSNQWHWKARLSVREAGHKLARGCWQPVFVCVFVFVLWKYFYLYFENITRDGSTHVRLFNLQSSRISTNLVQS